VDLFNGLNEAQRTAVEHIDGPLLVLAGPGSGKTRVVTTRVANLLNHGIHAEEILALTFTNKAAQEMQSRVSALSPGSFVWVSTFHRFCSQMLRRYADTVGLGQNFTIFDTDDSLAALKSVIERESIDVGRYTPRQLARVISNAKNDLVSAEQLAEMARSGLDAVAAEVFPHYQNRLLHSNAVDFDDLLIHVATMLRDNDGLREQLDARYRYILVDEYQDTNLAQYAIVRSLSILHPNLAVTGDPDQSIYAWRGANINNILEFERDYPQVAVVRLEQNYRSTQNILRVADSLIAHNVQRKAKSLFTENEEGSRVNVTEVEDGEAEANGIAQTIAAAVRNGEGTYRDCAILFRVNALSRNLEHALQLHGVPYQIINGVEFYKRKEIKDVLAYLHLINNPRNDVGLQRIINTPPRGIGKKTIGRLQDFARQHQMSLLEATGAPDLHASMSTRPAKALQKFHAEVQEMMHYACEPLSELVNAVLKLSGYRDQLEGSTVEEDRQRLANIEELQTAARAFDEAHPEEPTLEAFLEQAALVNETDAFESDSDRVTLMSLHAAKGLEFPRVFVIAVEQGIMPHERSSESPEQLEEERRLLFVGITRAKTDLHLSFTHHRDYRGRRRRSIASPFFMELDPEAAKFESQVAFETRALDESRRAQHPEYDESCQLEEYEPPPRTPQLRDPVALPPVMTAAELATDAATESIPVEVDDFSEGMLVTHPQYGPGQMTSLSGRGDKATCKVQFFQTAEEVTFRLKFSPLRPLRGTNRT
jgi:DNA helicase-2/ATP-dependent DNA helicase PcrA